MHLLTTRVRIKTSILMTFMNCLVLILQLICMNFFDFESNLVLILFVAAFLYSFMIFTFYSILDKFDVFTLFLLATFVFSFGHFVLISLGTKTESVFPNIVSQKTFIKAGFWNIYCISALFIGYLLAPIRTSCYACYMPTIDNSNVQLRRILRKVAIVFTVSSIYPAFENLLQDIELTKIYGYGYRIIESTNEATTSNVIGSFFLPAITAWLISKNNNEKIPIILLIAYFSLYLMSGSRLALVCTAFALLYYYVRTHKINTIRTIFLITILFLFLSIISFISTHRDASLGAMSLWEYFTTNSIFVQVLKEAGGTFRVSAIVMEHCPSDINHIYGGTYLYAFMYILPNMFTKTFMPNILNTDDAFRVFGTKYGGIGSSFSAEAYYNFGYFGVVICFLLGLIWGVIARKFDEALKIDNPIYIFISIQVSQAIFLMIRSDLVFRLRSLVWNVMPIIILALILYKKKRRFSES